MKILLTGHHGYIGSTMLKLLLELKHEVVGLDTDYFAGCDFGKTPQVPEIQKDIRDVWVSDLEGFDAVVHLAALSNDPMAEIERSLTYDINLFGTLHLAEVAKFAGVKRFLFSSSCSVYGAGAMTEDGTLYPISAYAVSKAKAEEGLLKLSDSGFSVTVLRNGTAYGISPKMRTDLVINAMARDAFLHGVIKVFGSGRLWRPVVHVEDISMAFAACLENSLTHNQIINVGSDEDNYYIFELAQFVRNASGANIEYIAGAKDARSYQVNFSKMARLLNWKPQWSAEAGAKQVYEAYVNFGRFGMEHNEFIRLDRIKKLIELGLVDSQLRWRNNG